MPLRPAHPRALTFYGGQVSAEAGGAAFDAIALAVERTLRGDVAAIATAPVNKEAFALAGLRGREHTDLLAHLTQTPRV
jgi:4-hydroxythreonine-4-phosphate dehydrogenase